MTIAPEQVRAARQLLGWTRIQLALNCPVSLATIGKIEERRKVKSAQTMLILKATFEAAGVEFITEENGRAGVRLRKPADRA